MLMDSDDVRSRAAAPVAAADPIRGEGWDISLRGEETQQTDEGQHYRYK